MSYKAAAKLSLVQISTDLAVVCINCHSLIFSKDVILRKVSGYQEHIVAMGIFDSLSHDLIIFIMHLR